MSTPRSEIGYKLMRLLAERPDMSQRDAAQALGVSLGKVNYCFQSLVRKGCVKVSRFKNSNNKAAYLYLLTPRGIEAKAKLTLEYLRIKTREYEALRAEIEQIHDEARAGR